MGGNFISKENIEYDDDATLVKKILNNACNDPNINIETYDIPDRNPNLDRPANSSNPICSICQKLEAVHTILPCKHQCICNKCLDNIGKLKLIKCPIYRCKSKIKSII